MENMLDAVLTIAFGIVALGVGSSFGKEVAVRRRDILNRTYRRFSFRCGTDLHWSQDLLLQGLVLILELGALHFVSTDTPTAIGTGLGTIAVSIITITYMLFSRWRVLRRLRSVSLA